MVPPRARRPWRGAVVLLAAAVASCAAAEQLPAPAAGASRGAAGSGGVNQPEHVDKPYIVLISFDGFRPDYLDRFELPNFRRVVQRGARAKAMIPVFPSVTFPNHYSLVTGLYPERHGIVHNTFFDPDRRATYSFRDTAAVEDGTWYRGEPIWASAERQGMVTACLFWPGSQAAIRGLRPTFWNTYDGRVSNNVRVDTVLGWLRLPADRRPHVITLYFNNVDAASHRAPGESAGIERAAKTLDRVLGRLLDGIAALPIKDRVHFLLTSDHGMAETSRSQTVQLRSLINPTGLRVGYTGAVAGLHVPGGEAQARRIRDAINSRLQRGQAYVRDELPERYHYRADPRAGDVVIVMDEGWTLQTSMLNRGLIQRRWGEHGWDPALPSMHALFVAAGPGIQAGLTVSEVDAVDVYPLMAELLGIRPAENIDGRTGRILNLISERKAPVRGHTHMR